MKSRRRLRRRYFLVTLLVLILGCSAQAGEIQFPSAPPPPTATANGYIHTGIVPLPAANTGAQPAGGEMRAAPATEMSGPLGEMILHLLGSMFLG
jgi:hypothetical protein